MIYPIHHTPEVVRVGVQTEQDVDVIGFDLKPWMDIFPDMTFTVFATRPGEDEAYPVNDQLMVGTVLYWHPDGYDTEIAGQGRVEVCGIGENQRKASGFVQTDIRATSLGKTKEPGESVAPWYASIIKAADEIKDAHGDSGLFLVREVNHVADRTVAEIVEAADAGKTVLLVKTGGKVYMLNNVILDKPTFFAVQSGTLQNPQGFGIVVSEAWIDTDGTVKGGTPNVSKTPNPYPIKLIGAVNAIYDGSSTVTVEIPKGGSGGGSTSKVVTILSDTTLTLADPHAGTYVLLSPFETKPEGGMLCTVTYNGVDYQCPAVDLDKGQGVVVALGNFALIGQEGGNAEAPFLLMCAPDGTEGMYAMMMVTDSPSGVTIGITAKVVDEAIRAYVDGKVQDALAAIPEPTTDVLTVTADVYNLEVSNMSHTYAEIAEAIKAGKAVQMVVNQGEDVASYALPLIMWQDSSSAQYAMFQRVFITGESTGGENVALTVKVNGKTGKTTAEYMELPYMTRTQVVELINEMTGGGGGDATTDVFYTANGEVFTTLDGAVMHVQKGEA